MLALEQLVELHQRAPGLTQLQVDFDQLADDRVDLAVVEQALGDTHKLRVPPSLTQEGRAALKLNYGVVDSLLAREQLGQTQSFTDLPRHQVGHPLVEHQGLAGVPAAQVDARYLLVQGHGLRHTPQLLEGLGRAEVDIVALGGVAQDLPKDLQGLGDVPRLKQQVGGVDVALERGLGLAASLEAVGEQQPSRDVSRLVFDDRLILEDRLLEIAASSVLLRGLQGLISPKCQMLRPQACESSSKRMPSGSRFRSRKWVS